MKIFVSHSSKDKEIAEKVHKVLTRLEIDHWIDLSEVREGKPVPTTIEEGFVSCTHFFLLWSVDASKSKWVEMERAKVLYHDEIKRIPFRIDDTKPALGFVSPYHSIAIGTAEIDIKRLLNIIRKEIDFHSQVKLFIETACDHYESLPTKPDTPVIKNFGKFDGFNYYVQQSYYDHSTRNAGQDVGNYVLNLIQSKLKGLDVIADLKKQIMINREEIEELNSKPEGKKYRALVRQHDDLFAIKLKILKDLEVSQATLHKIIELQELRDKLSEMKARSRKFRRWSHHGEIDSLEAKISIFETKIENVSTRDHKKLENAEATLSELDKILRLNKEIQKLEERIAELRSQNIIPVVGDYGSGKSALIHFLFYNFCKTGSLDHVPLFIPMGQLPHRDDMKNYLLIDIYEFIKKEYEFNLRDEDFRNRINAGKIILFLDGLDEMSNKLDASIAQNNLNNVLDLSKSIVTVLTSRHTYLTESMEQKLLIQHNGFIRILDFSKNEIERYLGLYLKNDPQKFEEIRHTIEQGKLGDLPQKPLFLNVICERFDELREYFPINESVILQVLTNGWIKHDVDNNFEDVNVRTRVTNERERISEILACRTYESGLPIGIPEIMTEVEEELQYEYSQARERLAQYYKDAVNSTFLVKESGEKYRFILNPVNEYFVAHRIISDVRNNDIPSFFKHVNIIKSPEVFEFIRGIIDIEWAIPPHVFQKFPAVRDGNDVLLRYRNLSRLVYDLINDVREGKYREKVGNIVKILYMSGNVPAHPDLHGIDLTGLDLSNSRLKGANMSGGTYDEVNFIGSNIREANLKGSKLRKAKLCGADLTGADLTGADLTGADLSNADLRGAIIKETNFTDASLRNSNLTSIIALESILNNTDISFSTLAHADLSQVYTINSAKLINVDLTTTKLPTLMYKVNFRDANLSGLTLSRCNLSYADLRDADLTNVRLHHATIKNADLRGSVVVNTDFDRATLGGSKIYAANRSSFYNADISGVAWM